MSRNVNHPRRPRYRKHRKHAKHLQEFLNRESARYDGNGTQTSVTAVNDDFSFAATISGSPGPYVIVGVPPAELRDVAQLYLKPFDEVGVDKAQLFGSNHDIGAGKNITLASHALSVNVTAASGTDTLTGTHGMETGEGPFQFTTDGVLPTGLAVSTDYYSITVDTTNFKPATSKINALAGTAIDFTDNGSGTHSLDRSFAIEQDMSADGILGYMGRGIDRDRIRTGIATASGILEVFE